MKKIDKLIQEKLSLQKELEELNIEIKEQEELISKLQTQLNELKQRKTRLIQANCEHVYENTNYCIYCSPEGEPKTQLVCKKCGKIAYKEGLYIYEVKE